MNNGKQPITPSMWTKCGDGLDDYQPLKDGQKTGWETKFGGLTKREYLASKAMQALASNPDWAKTMRTPDDWDEYKDRLASGAVELADALLAKLSIEDVQ